LSVGNGDEDNISTADDPSIPQDTKDGSALDWYVEGPGRRVGYDNMTAIDWIFEYAKERQRQRVLKSSNTGLSGYLVQFADASQIWAVLIATGIAAGLFAAFIDIASDWLADLKTGYCSNVEQGGRLYLSKTFCCWGHDGMYLRQLHQLSDCLEMATCPDWRSWSTRLHVTSTFGSFMIDYMTFIIFSVSY
jgi:chloride channel 3/4/5